MGSAKPRERHAGTTSLIDLLDRVIDGGALVSGDVIIALAGIDLIRLDLRLLLAPIERSSSLSRARL
ncbi:MAG: gas vesicle protein GvpJ [Kofleriaceae bacterium]